jgi:hypothetical protein
MEATAVSKEWVDNFEVESAAAIAEISSHNACCLFPNDRQKLFRVWNTANKEILVVANSASCAVYLARNSGHLKNTANGIAGEMPEDFLNANNAFAGSLRRAIKEGSAGCIKRVGNFATMPMQGLVFNPISSVN